MAEHSSSPFQRRYPPELRERAVRMVFETAAERGDRFGVVTRGGDRADPNPSVLLEVLGVEAAGDVDSGGPERLRQ
jgi:transposase-like protein